MWVWIITRARLQTPFNQLNVFLIDYIQLISCDIGFRYHIVCLWSMLYIWSELRNVVYLLRLEKNTCFETSLDRWQVIYGRQTGWILDLQHSIESAVQHNTWPGVSYRKRCTLSQCLASVSGRIVKIPYCYLSILARLFRLLRRMSLLRYHWLFWCRGVQAVLLLWQFP